MPAQHLEKPGMEADMKLKPQFMAPAYKGSGKLDGMSALIITDIVLPITGSVGA